MEKNNCIPVSIGILTFNSAQTLERCLKSLEGFCEIIIADGGSTDRTLDIAAEYNCKIIKQNNQGEPIKDFSLERNRLLDTAAYDWFFYLDSDEVITPELKEEFRKICTDQNPEFLIYNVAYHLVSPDLNTIYKQYKVYSQPRFFNKKTGARFKRKVHERIDYDRRKYKVGKIKEAWLVPLDIQMDFSVYKEKIAKRIPLMVSEYDHKSLAKYLRRGVLDPVKEIIKHLLKVIYVCIRYKPSEIIPIRYQFYRMYSQIYIMKMMAKINFIY